MIFFGKKRSRDALAWSRLRDSRVAPLLAASCQAGHPLALAFPLATQPAHAFGERDSACLQRAARAFKKKCGLSQVTTSLRDALRPRPHEAARGVHLSRLERKPKHLRSLLLLGLLLLPSEELSSSSKNQRALLGRKMHFFWSAARSAGCARAAASRARRARRRASASRAAASSTRGID